MLGAKPDCSPLNKEAPDSDTFVVISYQSK